MYILSNLYFDKPIYYNSCTESELPVILTVFTGGKDNDIMKLK